MYNQCWYETGEMEHNQYLNALRKFDGLIAKQNLELSKLVELSQEGLAEVVSSYQPNQLVVLHTSLTHRDVLNEASLLPMHSTCFNPKPKHVLNKQCNLKVGTTHEALDY